MLSNGKIIHQGLQQTNQDIKNEFPSPKYRPPAAEQINVDYQIPCRDCPWSYIGETGRCFNTRRKEHVRSGKNYMKGSNISNDAWTNDHTIDFESGKVIDRGNFRIRKTLESWHTTITNETDNNSKPLPGQYAFLLRKQ